jgi:4-amino-4-deoxy-L-arabinose transferase-like glycosyltransferase
VTIGGRAVVAIGGPAVIAITALAALLRFPTLDLQSFWVDEAVTAAWRVRPGLRETLLAGWQQESWPPVYYTAAWAWSKLFGTGEVGLRSLSAVAGTLTVPVAYRAAEALVSRRAGLVTAALVASNPLLVWYSQEARSYALLVLLTTASLLAFARALERPSGVNLAGWALASALAMATQPFAAIVVVPEAAWLIVRSENRRRAAAAVAAAGAAGAALLPLALNLASSGVGGWIQHWDLGSRLLLTGAAFLAGPLGAGIAGLVVPAAGLACIGLLALAAAAVGRERRGGLLALGLAAAAVAAPVGAALLGADFVLDRNLLPAAVPLMVAISAGLGAARAGAAGVLAAGGLATLFAGTVILTAARPELQREDWRAVAAALGDAEEPRLIVAPAHAHGSLAYYLPPVGRAVSRPARAREVIAIGSRRKPSLPSSLAQRFRDRSKRRVDRFRIVVLRAPRAVELSPKELSSTEVGAPEQGPAVVLVQPPTRP